MSRNRPTRLAKSMEDGGRTDISRSEGLLTTAEAAQLTGMSVAWYERKRWERAGPPYLKRGRTVRYVKTDLLAWWMEGDVSPARVKQQAQVVQR